MVIVDFSREEIKRQLQQMDPYKFEELVAELWELQGYETTVRQGSGDRGIDVEAIREYPCQQKILIQVKRYGEETKVGSEKVRKYATLYQQVPDADIVVILTTGEFTKDGTTLARDLDVRLVDGEKTLTQVETYNNELDGYIQDREDEEDTDESAEEYEETSRGDLIVEESNKYNYSEREEKYDRKFDDSR